MLRAGIVGLPNVGKSTLFNAVTRTRKAEAANYPFCTIAPNQAVVSVPDARLEVLAQMSKSIRTIPAAIEFVDIAGLVQGASKGEGLGNQFLSHIREVDAIVQVEPFRSALMETGNAEIVGWPYVETAPNTDITQYIALSAWVQKNHATAAKFVRAVIQGAQFAGSNEAATRDINQQFTNLNPTLKDKVLLPRLGDAINLQEMNHTMGMMLKYGLLKAPVDLSKRVFTP